MKRAIKPPTSLILVNGIVYIVNGNNKQLAEILKEEQQKFCAYTEKQISSTDLMEIDHFDPTLKDQPGDNYNNWFLIVAKWNRKKSKKWAKFQPILHPTSPDFYARIKFEDGIFQYEKNDLEAKNLINLLDLNNYELTKERERYVERMKELQNLLGEEGLKNYLLEHTEDIYFQTAFETTFGYGFILN